jgi:hypothetical protein
MKIKKRRDKVIKERNVLVKKIGTIVRNKNLMRNKSNERMKGNKKG